MKRINLLFFVILLIPLLGTGQNFYTLSGIITDSLSGKALDNIDIVVENELTGTISNYLGAYILYLEPGSYKIKYSSKGYDRHQISVKLTKDQIQLVELSPKIKISKNSIQNKIRFAFLKNKKNQELLSANQTTMN